MNKNHCQGSKAEESDKDWDDDHDDVSEDHDDVTEDHDDTSSQLNKETGILEPLITLSNLMWIL